VGDAGCHKDPFLALGLCDAFRDAELLAEALDAGLIAGWRRMNEALAEYHRQRDLATLPAYRLNLHLARNMALPVEMMQLRAAVRGDAEATRRYFLMNQGVEGVRV
jgi:2-polyprenyl-6-methoxyphenol hydroxylase-like FAD-dependent oxidoreductase